MNPPPIDPDPEEVEEIAEEIAEAVNDFPSVNPAEVDEATQDLTEWDDPPISHGSATPRVPLDDEIAVGEQLVDEGVDEAERDRRLAAADPDFEP